VVVLPRGNIIKDINIYSNKTYHLLTMINRHYLLCKLNLMKSILEKLKGRLSDPGLNGLKKEKGALRIFVV